MYKNIYSLNFEIIAHLAADMLTYILICFLCLNAVLSLESNETIAVNTTEQSVIIPKLKYTFELFNLENDYNFLKWLSVYQYVEDDTYLIEIATKNKLPDFSFKSKIVYEKTADTVLFTPQEFEEMYEFLTINNTLTVQRIKRAESEDLFITKFMQPFHVTIVDRKGDRENRKSRGLLLDWKEYQILISKGSQIMKDCGI